MTASRRAPAPPASRASPRSRPRASQPASAPSRPAASLAGVMARVKGIQYSSRTRTRMNTEAAAANVNLKQRLARLPERLPAHLRCAAQPDGATTYDLGEPSVARIRHPGGRT